MAHAPFSPVAAPGLVAAGRYVILQGGRECGEERWRIETFGGGLVATAEQVLEPPHPFPSRQEWRASLTSDWRLTGLEIEWWVGERRVRAVHGADGARWHARLESAGQVREQHGDYPAVCEVDFGSPLFSTFFLARRDFALFGEHEFPVLRIGPPWMAVSPERMRVRCVEFGRRETVRGSVVAKRYVVSLPPRGEDEGYTFWADAQGIVLEAHEGPEPSAPWMTLTGYSGQPLGGPQGGAPPWVS